jgi:hypothetical protein
MIRSEYYLPWSVCIEMREGNFMFSSDGLSNDYFCNIIEFIPILILLVHVTI